MGTGIEGPPNVYTAGLDFDYSVWTPGTRVDLVNVNWNNDYRDVVKFDSRDALNSYIDGRAPAGITINQLTYAKPGEDIYLGVPYNRVNRYNYLRASNPLMPIEGDIQRDYYYFILECEYVSPQNTRLRLQLDVWQTYVYDVTFGNCYVERGHIGIANTKAFDNFGRDYLTVPEGLDIGGEYRHIARKSEVLIRNTIFDGEPNDVDNGDVIVFSTVDIEESGGTAAAPILVSSSGSEINGMPSGADCYIFTSDTSFRAFMASIADKPWISQGIVSVTIMPALARYSGDGSFIITDGAKVIQLMSIPRKTTLFSNWRNNSTITGKIPTRYARLKKFFTYPYMIIEMTAWSGNPIILKPESWNNANADIIERASFMPPNQRVTVLPRGYNADSGAPVDNLWDLPDSLVNTFPEPLKSAVRDVGDDTSDYLDIALSISNFPSMPVVNNMSIGYLAANANQLAFQFTAADWTQQRALGSAQAQYDISTGAMHTAQNLAGIGISADIAQIANQNRTQAAQAIVNASNSLLSGVGNALTPGGFGGAAISGISNAAAGGINTGIGIASNDEALAIRNQQAGQTVQAQNRQAQLSRDTNKDLADWAARGDYANAIAGVNAKIQDARMIQPSTSGQFGGESHNIGTNKLEISIRWKLIDNASIRVIGEYWLRFGYAIRAFVKPPQSLMVMSKFTYWKMMETYIAASNVPEGHKQVIRGILEKGVTVWKNPTDIGQIDLADNVPLGGITY